MKAALWLAVCSGAAAIAAWAGGAMSIGLDLSIEPPTSETVQTVAAYVPDQKLLSLRCDKASEGLCRIIVDNAGRRRELQVRAGAYVTIGGVVPGARTCTGGRRPITACDWTPVNSES